jgi:hypothetical protein
VTRYDRYRWAAVALLLVAATLSAYATHHHDRGLEALSYACFLGAVFAVLAWRRARRASRASRGSVVFDREAKTRDETRTGPDQ